MEITETQKALELISEGKISNLVDKENDEFYHVVGSHDEYLVILPKLEDHLICFLVLILLVLCILLLDYLLRNFLLF